MEEQEESQHNMISNLPLLFANGYPTSLEKITEKQLENFIPFMVQCSLGHINLQSKMDYSEPEWWPEDLPFIVPFSRPRKFTGDWLEKMKEIVVICYQFHKSLFLLRFCNDLASYEHASLRFINNYNSTTSLFDRRSSKLLVTFRNENMSYDQPQRSRKCLLQQKSKHDQRQTDVHQQQQMMVEPAPFDIYLCDNCDAELYSKEAVLEHEKTCQAVDDDDDDDDDDVILCDTPEPCEVMGNSPANENDELRKGFLLNFGLQIKQQKAVKDANGSLSNTLKEENFVVLDRNRRVPRRNRNVHTLSRCPTIPLSSPAGQLLLKTTKAAVPPDYLLERLERMERFCHTPILTKSTNHRPRYLDRKFMPTVPVCTFKKPNGYYSSHIYVFPRRQFSQKRRRENMLFLNSTLLKRCRPISVRLKKIKRDMPSSTKLNIKLTRDTSRASNWKISSCSSEIIVDIIDLCSSDDDDNDVPPKTTKNNYSKVNSSSSVTLRKSMPAALTPKPIKAEYPNTSTTTVSSQQRTSLQQQKLGNSEYLSVNNSSSPRRSIVTKIDKPTTPPVFVSDVIASGVVKTSPIHDGYSIPQAPSAAGAAGLRDIGMGSIKPLRPLYIFSNYSTHSNEVMSSSSSVDNNAAAAAVFRGNNQENHMQSVGLRKRSTIGTSTTPSTTSWNPVTNNFGQISQSSDSNSGIGIQNHHLQERERSSRSSISLAQKFNTPSRIISIDLTS